MGGALFSDLEKAESAVLYAPVGSLGRLLMEIEQNLSVSSRPKGEKKCESTVKEMFMSEQRSKPGRAPWLF